MQKKVIQVDQKVSLLQGLPLSFQHLFAMFGASILVPALFNGAAGKTVIDPSLVLLMNGIGTILYLVLCKGRAPAYLGSSFAFLAPTFAVLASTGGDFSKALGGYIVSGLVFVAVALLVGVVGTKWIDVVLPPAAMGPIVALIGLELSIVAAGNAGLVSSKQSVIENGAIVMKDVPFDINAVIVSLFTLAVVILGSMLFRGFLAIIPVLVAIIAGYGLSAVMGVVDYSRITGESFFSMPQFTFPSFNMSAIMIILPATLVVVTEHIGHLMVTSKIVGRDLVKDPGLHRSLLGDGISTVLSGAAGSVPTTTYGENMGVMAITKVYSVWIIGGAGVISIILAFFGNLKGIINSIPGPVMGGISLFLFGLIAASGIRVLVDSKVDYSKSKNLILTAVVFIVGIAGANDPSQGLPSLAIKIGDVYLKGMALAALVGMSLSLLFYIFDRLKLTNEA
ncbi:uracil permease [Anaerobacterium chartisolvens]|uniref:Uracil permease n=1 Tax=Anaerobacterium chartisolvens TaxID=1297424 RepID=A0A369B9H4_9FIRM|nr:uracil permease [Anaerobacterium chartisolvens]RCX17177.1 uracil permease [Anaerobacterium chartisolvens]